MVTHEEDIRERHLERSLKGPWLRLGLRNPPIFSTIISLEEEDIDHCI